MKAFLDRYIAFGRSWFGPVLGVGFRVANHADLPTCTEELRRVTYAVEGGTDVADTLVVCRKTATNTYEWRDVSNATPTITTRTNTSASIANGATGTVTATCNADEVRLGGGHAHSTSVNTAGVYSSYPSGTLAWTVDVRNGTGGAMTTNAYVVCAKFGA